MSFHNLHLPDFVSIWATGGPVFITDCATSASGREVRNSSNIHNQQSYKIVGCKLSNDQFHQFNSFFRAREGQRFSFLMKDYVDFEVKNQWIPKENNMSQEIELCKIYEDPIATYIRKITKPRAESLKLFVNGAEIRDYELNQINGKVRVFSALPDNSILTASFKFDVQVRFSKDDFTYNYCPDGAIEILGLELIEVHE